MGSDTTKKRFGMLLTALLLFQLSFHTLHVFTHHVKDSHTEHTALDTQINEGYQQCELCAKLLGQTLFLWVGLSLLISFAVFAITSNVNELVFVPGPPATHLLRGPPSIFI